jgi:hypothetical protein
VPSPPASTTAHRPELPGRSIRIDSTRLSIISPFFDLFARSGFCETPSVITTSLSDPLQGCRGSVDTVEGCSHIDYSRRVNNAFPLPIKSLGRMRRYLAAIRNSGGKCPTIRIGNRLPPGWALPRPCRSVRIGLRHGSRDAEFLHFGDQRSPLQSKPGGCTLMSAYTPPCRL